MLGQKLKVRTVITNKRLNFDLERSSFGHRNDWKILMNLTFLTYYVCFETFFNEFYDGRGMGIIGIHLYYIDPYYEPIKTLVVKIDSHDVLLSKCEILTVKSCSGGVE